MQWKQLIQYRSRHSIPEYRKSVLKFPSCPPTGHCGHWLRTVADASTSAARHTTFTSTQHVRTDVLTYCTVTDMWTNVLYIGLLCVSWRSVSNTFKNHQQKPHASQLLTVTLSLLHVVLTTFAVRHSIADNFWPVCWYDI